MDKNSLRIWAKDIRSKIDMSFYSDILVKKLMNTFEYKNSKNIMIYYPLENEVNLLPVLEDNSKRFFLPKIEGTSLLCCPFKKGDKTCFSCFKTCEPLTSPCDKSEIDLIIVPALTVDKKGYRLGYGGGFYDRFLKDFKGITMTFIPFELIAETIYPEEYDIKINKIITEKGDI